MGNATYYTLIGSLPALPACFDRVDRVPITELRLRERTSMLDADDQATVRQVFDFLLWDRQDQDQTDEQVCARFEHLMEQLDNEVIREAVQVRTDLRTIVSALRRRRRDQEPPIGVGQWVGHIQHNWRHPTFRLGGRYPWIESLQAMLDGPQPMAAGHRLLAILWEQWSRMADRQKPFSFESLLLYLFRYEVVFRWTNRDVALGRQKFEQLVSDAMGDHGQLFA